jgi:hypothetical protein
MVPPQTKTFPPVAKGHIRGHGCRALLVYCGSGRCHHSPGRSLGARRTLLHRPLAAVAFVLRYSGFKVILRRPEGRKLA